jgi:hypothetical protein
MVPTPVSPLPAGRDEVFRMGLVETCAGYQLISQKLRLEAERRLIAAMQKPPDFGSRYQYFEITVALTGIRAGVERLRQVQSGKYRVFDVGLHPTLRLAAKADDSTAVTPFFLASCVEALRQDRRGAIFMGPTSMLGGGEMSCPMDGSNASCRPWDWC